MGKKNRVKIVDRATVVGGVTGTDSTTMGATGASESGLDGGRSNLEYFVGISMNDSTLVCCYAPNLQKPTQTIYNENGDYTTPVVGVLTEDKMYVGAPALNVAQYMPRRTLLNPLHILAGSGLGASSEDTELPTWWEFGCPLTVSCDTGTVVYDIENGETRIGPETLVQEYFCKARAQCSAVLETQQLFCVLTYPDTFTDTQCEVLLQAADRASLRVCSLLPESLAIALAFRIDQTLYSGTRHTVVNIGYMCTTVQFITNDCGYMSLGLGDGHDRICNHSSPFTLHIGIHDFILEILSVLNLPSHIDPYVRHTIADMVVQQYIEYGRCNHITVDSLIGEDLEYLHTSLSLHALDIENAIDDVTDVLVEEVTQILEKYLKHCTFILFAGRVCKLQQVQSTIKSRMVNFCDDIKIDDRCDETCCKGAAVQAYLLSQQLSLLKLPSTSCILSGYDLRHQIHHRTKIAQNLYCEQKLLTLSRAQRTYTLLCSNSNLPSIIHADNLVPQKVSLPILPNSDSNLTAILLEHFESYYRIVGFVAIKKNPLQLLITDDGTLQPLHDSASITVRLYTLVGGCTNVLTYIS